jgi:hypothetical protein
MAKGIYVGIGGTPRKINKSYIGIGGTPRKVKKVYVGVGGSPRLAWSSDIQKVTSGLPSISANSYYTNFLNGASVGNYAIITNSASDADVINNSLVRTGSVTSYYLRSRASASTYNYGIIVGGIDSNNHNMGSGDIYNTSLVRTTISTDLSSNSAGCSFGNYALFADPQYSSATAIRYISNSLVYGGITGVAGPSFCSGANAGNSYAVFSGGSGSFAVNTSLVATNISGTINQAGYNHTSASVGNYALFGGMHTVRGVNSSLVAIPEITLTAYHYDMDSFCACGSDNYAIFAGGNDLDRNAVNTVDVIDANLVRTTLTLTTAREYAYSLKVGSYLLVAGGYYGSTYLHDIEAFEV